MATDYNQLIKNNFVKLVVLMVLSMLFGIVAFGLFTNKHINLWVVEFNGEKKEAFIKKDTVFVNEPMMKRDTVFLETQSSLVPKTFETLPKQQSTQSKVKLDTVVVSQKNFNSGTNNGIIGDNGVINKPIQPHPVNALVEELEKKIPNKSMSVRFMFSSNSKFSKVFTDELIDMFKHKGYTDVNWIVDLANEIKAPPRQVTLMSKHDPGVVQFFVNAED